MQAANIAMNAAQDAKRRARRSGPEAGGQGVDPAISR